ncbi:hypothetical protein [Streptomyces sp. NPDC058373]|uniref:hypothetical protein n=1 Tax=Streptomyces sp. NPDC058373 TaxID=3346465 RepID=UPI0036532BA4
MAARGAKGRPGEGSTPWRPRSGPARHLVRAAERCAEALADALARRGTPGGEDPADEPSPLITALVREAVPALLAAERPAAAREAYRLLHPATRARGRFRLLEAQLLPAEGSARPRSPSSPTGSRWPTCARATRC